MNGIHLCENVNIARIHPIYFSHIIGIRGMGKK